MKFVRNLVTSTGKRGDGEGDVPLKAQMAYFFEICESFCRKNEAQKLQVEKIGIPAKNSEDYVKCRVTFDSMLPWNIDCNVSTSRQNFFGQRALKILSIQLRL